MTILMLETIDNDAKAVLETAGDVILSPTPNAHAHDLPFADVKAIVTRGLGQLDRALIERCPQLKVIARCGAGLNNLDLVAANENDIPVVFAPGINANAVGEHSLMLMLMAMRQGFRCATEVKQGNWDCRNQFAGDDMAGKKVCIVGSGNIGRKTAELCNAFSMDVAICGRGGNGVDGLKAALGENLPDSDIISLHIPLTDETRHLIANDLLGKFKTGAILINTARGELINTSDICAALDSGKLSAYAADLVEGNPADSQIIAHPNSIITPHVAAMTKNTYREMCVFTARNVAAVLRNTTPDQNSIYRESEC